MQVVSPPPPCGKVRKVFFILINQINAFPCVLQRISSKSCLHSVGHTQLSCMRAIILACKLRELHALYMHAACKLHACCVQATGRLHAGSRQVARWLHASCMQGMQTARSLYACSDLHPLALRASVRCMSHSPILIVL